MTTLSDTVRARVRETFEAQGFMKTLGIDLVDFDAGRVRFGMPYSSAFSQQHGFMHAGAITTALDSACGFAAFTLMPDDAEVLTVELKVSLLAPAKGDRFLIDGQVIKAGRTLTFTEGTAYAAIDGGEKPIAKMTATMMTVRDRPDIRLAAASK